MDAVERDGPDGPTGPPIILVTARGFEGAVLSALAENGIHDVALEEHPMEASEGEATCGWIQLHRNNFSFDESLFQSCGVLFAVAALVKTRFENLPPTELLSAITQQVQHSPHWPAVLQMHGQPSGPFRTSGVRSGSHEFGSSELLQAVAGSVIEATGWGVDLDHPTVEVLMYVYASFSLFSYCSSFWQVMVMVAGDYCLVGLPWGIHRPEATMARPIVISTQFFLLSHSWVP